MFYSLKALRNELAYTFQASIFAKNHKELKHYFLIVLVIIALGACQKIEVYEKTVPFAKHEWTSQNKPSFTFTIEDTVSLYNLFLVIRHADAYNYNNIWVNLSMKGPKDRVSLRREFVLANNSQGWLGSGMDDIYEHRIPFSTAPARLQKGQYTFTVKQDMREDPLNHILNVGIRVEKAK
jgi:gliding motility-associated lipoprotein GldH